MYWYTEQFFLCLPLYFVSLDYDMCYYYVLLLYDQLDDCLSKRHDQLL